MLPHFHSSCVFLGKVSANSRINPACIPQLQSELGLYPDVLSSLLEIEENTDTVMRVCEFVIDFKALTYLYVSTIFIYIYIHSNAVQLYNSVWMWCGELAFEQSKPQTTQRQTCVFELIVLRVDTKGFAAGWNGMRCVGAANVQYDIVEYRLVLWVVSEMGNWKREM